MFCPQCKYEYIPGATRCSDCDVALVDRLLEPTRDSDGELLDANLKLAWKGKSQNECVSICDQLRVAEIPFKVLQQKEQFFKDVDEHYEIGVLPEFYDKAKEIIGNDSEGDSDEPIDLAEIELPAEDDVANAKEIDEDWDPDNWDQENATVEIQFQSELAKADMIEACLRENHIHCRLEDSGERSKKIFVMPEDEIRAREIAHEIEEGTPLK